MHTTQQLPSEFNQSDLVVKSRAPLPNGTGATDECSRDYQKLQLLSLLNSLPWQLREVVGEVGNGLAAGL